MAKDQEAERKRTEQSHAEAVSALGAERAQHDAAMSDLRATMQQKLDQQLAMFQQQLADAKAQHGIREDELTQRADAFSQEVERLKIELATRPVDGDAGLRTQIEVLKATSTKDQDMIAMLTKQLERVSSKPGHASSHKHGASTRSQPSGERASRTSEPSESYYIGDGDDEYESEDEYEEEEYTQEEWDEWYKRQGISSYAHTITQTQTTPPAASASAAGSAGGGAGGRPPRPPSDNDGGSRAGSADRRKGRKLPGGGGGGGGDGSPDGDPNGGDGNGNGDANSRRGRRAGDASDSERDRPGRVPRKKEADEVKFNAPPKHAHECRTWLLGVIDAVTAAAGNGERAMLYAAKVLQDSARFEDFAVVPDELKSLDDKIRATMSKHLQGKEAENNKELSSALNKRREQMLMPASGAMPVIVGGMQLVYLVKAHFKIHDSERVQFDIIALIALEYPGDAKLASFKDHWDKMVLNLVTPLGERDKLGILVAKLKGSERLKPHLEHLERLPQDHPDNSYVFVSNLIDKLIDDDRKKRNTESLVLDASGKEQKPKKQPGAPGRRKKGEDQGGDADDSTRSAMPGVPSDSKGKGKGKGKDGKGKGKGGKDGKGDAQQQASGYESSGSYKGKPAKEYAGKSPSELPEADRCCAHFLWVRKDGTSFCKKFNQGVECYAQHVPPSKCPKAMKSTNTFNKLKTEHGPMNCPESGPKAPAKKKDE